MIFMMFYLIFKNSELKKIVRLWPFDSVTGKIWITFIFFLLFSLSFSKCNVMGFTLSLMHSVVTVINILLKRLWIVVLDSKTFCMTFFIIYFNLGINILISFYAPMHNASQFISPFLIFERFHFWIYLRTLFGYFMWSHSYTVGWSLCFSNLAIFYFISDFNQVFLLYFLASFIQKRALLHYHTVSGFHKFPWRPKNHGATNKKFSTSVELESQNVCFFVCPHFWGSLESWKIGLRSWSLAHTSLRLKLRGSFFHFL